MEQIVSSGIINAYFEKLNNSLEMDTAIVGAGPSGLTAAYYLAKAGKKVCIFESNLAPGGGMWGGAMMFNNIVLQKEALYILDELNIEYKEFSKNTFVIDSIQATSALIYHATKAGAKIFNCYRVEDTAFTKNNEVCGVVVNFAPVLKEGLHVDPLIMLSKTVLDATGHPCEVANTVANKNGVKLNTPSGKVMGEKSLNVEEGERLTVENTKEIYPNLFVSGMAANGVSGSFRMGPIFGGMLRSGEKVAKLIIEKLSC